MSEITNKVPNYNKSIAHCCDEVCGNRLLQQKFRCNKVLLQ